MAVKAEVDAAAVKNFAKTCEDKHAELVIEIRNLKTYEDGLTANWQGAAKVAFDSFMERYYYQADRVNDRLLETAEKLVATSGRFTDSDEAFEQSVTAHVSSLDLPPV